jgi:osmotically-inducible protein OsmY
MTTAVLTSTDRDLRSALHRDADIGAHGIVVRVSDNAVVLTGHVRSWQERESAAIAAMHAPGIVRVDNLIDVVPVPRTNEEESEAPSPLNRHASRTRKALS